ncbi:TlpA family protein disulfide reductase [Sphaerotilus microaerophilus]|uniref:Thioredoxin domain-containing protein n=1 Tax=Sphaerotilus microaerophilus TaxID=2914710 RepID=A0ABM7YLG9_9BURK|nr:redoxin domain-containing protein [Sphaerotilus sp. FB-5]BDI05287.1 hypothetical protein CATMQ487_22570 [Sphaerotilus sp. FB-5]
MSLLARRTWLAGTAAGLLGPAGLGALAAEPQRRPWPIVQEAPPLVLDELDGAPWRLADQRGQAVLVNFWASWCEPCRSEMPTLELLATRHEREGLVIVAVNFKEGAGTIRRFVEQTAFSLPVLRDPDGLAAKAWGARMFPTTVGIGRDGRPRWTVRGEADWLAAPTRAWVAELLR